MPDFNIQIIIYAILICFLLGGLILWISLLKRKKPKVETKKIEIEPILLALGGIENILSIQAIESRVKLIIKDIKSVNAHALSELKISAVLKQNELTLLIKEQPKLFVSQIQTMKKEVE